jgi:hypothetical protein
LVHGRLRKHRCGLHASAAAAGILEGPFAFTGEVKQVVMDLSGELIKEDEATLKRMMANR